MNENSFLERPMMGQRPGRGHSRPLLPLAAGALLAWGLLAPLPLPAHGGEDHGAAEAVPAATPGAAALSTHGSAGRFELLLKYPPPEAGKPVRLRFFLADYATNRPVEGTRFVVASRPRGISTQAPPAMTSPGVYEMVAVFPADTVYSLVATLAAGDASEQIVLPNVYAGEAAERFLAEHGGAVLERSSGSAGWLVPVVIAVAALLGILSFLGARTRIGKGGSPRPVKNPARGADETTENIHHTTAPDRREEPNR